jgi:hypothetical protein
LLCVLSITVLEEKGWEKMKHPLESQYLAASDFYRYLQQKKSMDVHELTHIINIQVTCPLFPEEDSRHFYAIK